ncbi:MAG TPA: HDOD domain-containing protein [Planctomycetaceae bacterium]|nr:HDOD domain-containing protein [Planctomycetaceae bacterium]
MDGSNEVALLRSVCRLGSCPLPPKAVRLALELAGDDNLSDEAIIVQVESDEKLRLGLLIVANLSIFCGGRAAKTVRQAVAQIGRRKCLSALWLLALSDFLRSWKPLHERPREKLWRHLLLAGVLAQKLQVAARLENPGEGLAAGMAHDIGHVLLAGPAPRLGIIWHEEHDQLIERNLSPAPERDHCRLGAALLGFWNAPGELIASALDHHDPASAPAAHRPLVAAVRLADLLAEHLDLDRPAYPLHLESARAWQEAAALEPWNKVPDLERLAIEQLPDALAISEHVANALSD